MVGSFREYQTETVLEIAEVSISGSKWEYVLRSAVQLIALTTDVAATPNSTRFQKLAKDILSRRQPSRLMDINKHPAKDRWDPEPRWPAFIAILAVASLYVALPRYLVVGPQWLFPSIVGALLVPTLISHKTGHHGINKFFGFTVNVVITIGMIASVALLIRELPTHKESATDLLLSAAFLWLTNILVFALWYWRLDAGGPHGRDKRFGHPQGAFLFPQMTMTPEGRIEAGEHGWSPNFFDYLFLSFNTSTAFSPTDVPVLARWGKVLMMLQSLISLTVLVLLAARAVNIL